MRMLAPALWRYGCLCPFEDLQERLLNTFAGDVTGDRRVLGLAGHLVDLVDVDDPGLGSLDVEVGGLDQFEKDVLDVLTNVPGLGERGCVGDGERDVQEACQGLGHERLAGARGTDHQDVGLLELNVLVGHPLAGTNPLVVVVHGDGEDLLRLVLADDVLVEEIEDLVGLRKLREGNLFGLGELLVDDLVAEVDAFVTDVDAGPGD